MRNFPPRCKHSMAWGIRRIYNNLHPRLHPIHKPHLRRNQPGRATPCTTLQHLLFCTQIPSRPKCIPRSSTRRCRGTVNTYFPRTHRSPKPSRSWKLCYTTPCPPKLYNPKRRNPGIPTCTHLRRCTCDSSWNHGCRRKRRLMLLS